MCFDFRQNGIDLEESQKTAWGVACTIKDRVIKILDGTFRWGNQYNSGEQLDASKFRLFNLK